MATRKIAFSRFASKFVVKWTSGIFSGLGCGETWGYLYPHRDLPNGDHPRAPPNPLYYALYIRAGMENSPKIDSVLRSMYQSPKARVNLEIFVTHTMSAAGSVQSFARTLDSSDAEKHRNFKCGLCGKGYFRADHLSRHINSRMLDSKTSSVW
jgi:hypothetical protein